MEQAARSCNYCELKRLIESGSANVNVKISAGKTPLVHAASEGRSECVELLIKSGADVNRTDFRGRTALIVAAERYVTWGGVRDTGCTPTSRVAWL